MSYIALGLGGRWRSDVGKEALLLWSASAHETSRRFPRKVGRRWATLCAEPCLFWTFWRRCVLTREDAFPPGPAAEFGEGESDSPTSGDAIHIRVQ